MIRILSCHLCPLNVIDQSSNAIALAVSLMPKLRRYGVWEEVDKEAWMNILTGKWVHTQKGDKKKSRWVARGFQ